MTGDFGQGPGSGVDRNEVIRSLDRLSELIDQRRGDLRAADCVPILRFLMVAAEIGEASNSQLGEAMRWRVVQAAAQTGLQYLDSIEMTICTECGSPELQDTGWIETNLGVVAGGDPGSGEYYCGGCGADDPEVRSIKWTDEATGAVLKRVE